ncbi:Transcriptional coactivator YAP1 [Nymphon striatum]|nr:Transcriptional coactivator YAP1 [Nymphon striatum]
MLITKITNFSFILSSHVTQTTTWEDPRRKGTVASGSLQQHTNNTSTLPLQLSPPPPLQLPPPPPLPPAPSPSPISQSTSSVPNILTTGNQTTPTPQVSHYGANNSGGVGINPQTLGTLPEGWEQAVTPEGEIYFINHRERNTSWFDPRIPAHLQRPTIGFGENPPMPSPIVHFPVAGDGGGTSVRQQQVRVQRLFHERERLRNRREELFRQGVPNNMVNNSQSQTHSDLLNGRNINDELVNASSPTNDLLSTSAAQTVTGMDPFLGQVNSNTSSAPTTPSSDYHSRQESADSGLGMGPGSFPAPPEEFLSGMDEGMDSANTDESQSQTPNPDLSTLSLGGSEDNNMDSDDLVPSLQDIGTDILKDVEAFLNTNKMDTVLTWL